VTVTDEIVGAIGTGLCVFVGVTHTDDVTHAERLARRLWGLRIFEDEHGLVNRSAEDLGLEVLVISQFTLYADTSRGRRPSFVEAAPPGVAEALIDAVSGALRRRGARVATGRFGASMKVQLVNDGPFTVILES
jgi:D-tyrosyl-tRNA(Tyr) deacylase